jgi:V/A-type H+/Na+-transporting ATPase subunit E
MEQKLQELTEKIYREGVEKGAEQARSIIADAQSKAAAIIADAQAQANTIMIDAEKKAQELRQNTMAEIRLRSTQALASIKQQILNIITAKVIDTTVTSLLSDPVVIKEFVALAIKNWNIGSGAVPLEVLLPEQKQQELTTAFERAASALLTNGISCSFSKNLKAGFRIGPQNGSYKISCTDEDFAELFKEYLRPRTRAWLFGEQGL